MRIFVTGASGYVGSAAVKDMVAAGHEVIGLARSDASAAAVRALGAEPLRGDLTDLDSLRRGAERADAVAHLAFNHDFSTFAENGRVDAAAIAAMGEALTGTDKPIVTTSGTGMVAQGQLATEDMVRPDTADMPRVSEQATRKLLDKGIRAMVVRLPQVNGPHNHGFVPILIQIARAKGYAAYVGDGANRWPACHRDDAARVYRLAIEKGRAGRNYHAVAEEGLAMRDLMEVIAQGLGVPLRAIAPDEAADYFGWFAMFAQMDNPSSSAITRAELGWHPTGPTTFEDMRNEDYFGAA
ncbi:SDR family oxidoreductase [Sphingomonas sp. MMSM20]|uniref:SDR family oxidoreductase n=1 Tax=Sphingomonas lycopersici TaxID=2951807 RepID=UPI002238B6FB|nr:SDR family oxidoreductase [Sphingomonas lycopersici]MCW6528974.1 SDR family oxidoreductase [Sphingomonas lycopersici]